jgi:transposase
MGLDLATYSVIASVAGTAVSFIGQMQQGEANAAAARYQAAVARNNQIISEQNAIVETQKGQQMEAAKREQTAQATSMQRARLAAAGVALDSGSPVRIQEDIASLGELDALTIRNNAARAAYGYRSQGLNYAAQAGLDDMRSQNVSTAGTLGAFSSLIGGASSVSDKWLRFRNAGIDGFGAG